jgi:hypothetical protein
LPFEINQKIVQREFNLVKDYNPGPGYYGVTRNPKYADVYKTSFLELYRENPKSQKKFQGKLRAPTFKVKEREDLYQKNGNLCLPMVYTGNFLIAKRKLIYGKNRQPWTWVLPR